jgi:hypothetical protein
MSSADVAARGGIQGMLNTGRARSDTLRVLAENTDGRAIVDTNGLQEGFRKISDELSAYYLLGYSSTNTNLDGRFHRIEVKVDRPKVSAAWRSGPAPQPPPRLSPRPPGGPGVAEGSGAPRVCAPTLKCWHGVASGPR